MTETETVNVKRAVGFTVSILLAVTLSSVVVTQMSSIETNIGGVKSTAIAKINVPVGIGARRPTVRGSAHLLGGVATADLNFNTESCLMTDCEWIPDWRDPFAPEIDEAVTIFPSGMVALTDTILPDATKFADTGVWVTGQCLTVPNSRWTNVLVGENGSQQAMPTVSDSAGFVYIGVNHTIPCAGHLQTTPLPCNAVVSLVASGTPTLVQVGALEMLGDELVYGVRLQVHGSHLIPESTGVTATCWGIESTMFDSNGSALIQFDSPEEAMALQASGESHVFVYVLMYVLDSGGIVYNERVQTSTANVCVLVLSSFSVAMHWRVQLQFSGSADYDPYYYHHHIHNNITDNDSCATTKVYTIDEASDDVADYVAATTARRSQL